MKSIADFLLTVTGINNPTGYWYAFWSGFGGDLSMLGGIFIAYKKLTCHVSTCWRLGHFKVDKTPYKVCKKHHPKTPDKRIKVHHIER